MSQEELSASLEEGYQDVLAGHTRPAADVFSDMAEDGS